MSRGNTASLLGQFPAMPVRQSSSSLLLNSMAPLSKGKRIHHYDRIERNLLWRNGRTASIDTIPLGLVFESYLKDCLCDHLRWRRLLHISIYLNLTKATIRISSQDMVVGIIAVYLLVLGN